MFHDLRHTFASRLAQAGVDPYTIQKLMGHKSFSTTQRYAHHYTESLRRGISALERPRQENQQERVRNPNSPLVETSFPGLFGPARGENSLLNLNEIAGMKRHACPRRSKKPLCQDSPLLAQEVWQGEREIIAVLRISRSALYRWMKLYSLPVAYVGRGMILSKAALSGWSRGIAARQNTGTK